MNICARCVHNQGARSGAIWYDCFCRHPSQEAVLTVDPVTGDSANQRTDDLGGKFFTNQKYPYCREVNPDGECKHYERN